MFELKDAEGNEDGTGSISAVMIAASQSWIMLLPCSSLDHKLVRPIRSAALFYVLIRSWACLHLAFHTVRPSAAS